MRLLWLALSLVVGCRASPPPATSEVVPQGAVARCADRVIVAPMVSAVASARQLPPRQAVEALASDARAATEAERDGLPQDPAVRQRIEAAQVRALLASMARAHSAPTTPEELRRVRADHWLDFDRPEGATVIHAVAIGEGKDAARRVAEAIAEATRGATDSKTFQERASAVPHPDVEVKVETLPPVSADGRVLDESNGSFDPIFSAAALALPTPGAQSPVIATSFGYHVLFLIARTPAAHPDDASLTVTTRDEILSRRQSESMRALIASLRARDGVKIDRDVDDILRGLDAARAKR